MIIKMEEKKIGYIIIKKRRLFDSIKYICERTHDNAPIQFKRCENKKYKGIDIYTQKYYKIGDTWIPLNSISMSNYARIYGEIPTTPAYDAYYIKKAINIIKKRYVIISFSTGNNYINIRGREPNTEHLIKPC